MSCATEKTPIQLSNQSRRNGQLTHTLIHTGYHTIRMNPNVQSVTCHNHRDHSNAPIPLLSQSHANRSEMMAPKCYSRRALSNSVVSSTIAIGCTISITHHHA